MVMVSRAAAVAALATVLAQAGCAPPKPAVDVAKEAAAIKAGEVAWNADWKAKAVDRLLAHYTPDAVVYASGFPAVHGRDETRKMYDQLFADPAWSLSFTPDAVEVSASGDMAVVSGRYDQTATDPKTKAVMKQHGAYVTTYKKGQDGVWRAFQDAAVSTGPDTPAS